MHNPGGLAVRALSAGYGATVVLEEITLEVPARGSLAVLGRNGAGKTTLVASIMGHTTLHGGHISHGGTDLARLPPYERARQGLGYVPQTRDVFPSLTLEENLTVAARPGRWTLARVYQLFPALESRRRHAGSALSGGEQQMLAIGRALMGNPSLLLLDEPFEGLAPIVVETLMEALARLIREESMAVVLVEQHAALALEITQEALLLERGRIAHRGPSAALAADPARLSALIMSS